MIFTWKLGPEGPGSLSVPVAQFFSEQGGELDAPFAKGFVTDHNAAPVESFLHLSGSEGQLVIEPGDVMNDRHRKATRHP